MCVAHCISPTSSVQHERLVETRGEEDEECRQLLQMKEMVRRRIDELNFQHATNETWLRGRSKHAALLADLHDTEWKTLAEGAQKAMRPQ